MKDLLEQITAANSKRNLVNDENVSYNFQVEPVKLRKPFISAMNPVSTEFNPILPMKPKLLSSQTLQRCMQPDRSFTRSQVGPVLKMDVTPQPFKDVKLDKSNYSHRFLIYLVKHNKERLRHLHAIRRPHNSAQSRQQPFRGPCSSSRSFTDYPLHIIDEKVAISRRMNGYLLSRFFHFPLRCRICWMTFQMRIAK